MKQLLMGLALALSLGAAGAAEAPPAAPKLLRYNFRVAETGFDPARITDLYSRAITGHIFEGLYSYDHLARPAKLVPVTAAGMPEVSADFKTWTIKIKPGIFFADDPVFKGRKRELVAEDYVYVLKRTADPVLNSPHWSEIDEQGFVGLAEYRAELLKSKGSKPFDYDRPIAGLRALDRYTLQLTLKETRPRLIDILAQTDLYGATAREAIEHYGEQSMGHPVGTGPFVLKQWRRSSLIVLEKNPDYRERYYEAQPNADDAEGQALLARFKGRRIPMVDRVEVSIIEENQPRWLSFLGGEFDLLERVPEDFINQAMPNGRLAPNLAKRGIQAYRSLASDVLYTVFNMEDPVVGGYTADKIALRRAIGLATNGPREMALVRRGQAVVAQSLYLPNTSGYDPAYKSEMGEYDPARANALLDLYGYKDVDGDGWRELPDGSALELESLTTPDGFQRQIDELWQKSLAKVGLKLRYKVAKWPENLKSMRAGKFQLWALANSASMPDGKDSLAALHSGHIGTYNYARFSLPEMDKLFDAVGSLPDGPERDAIFLQSKRLATAYMPYKYRGHRYLSDLAHAQLIGYRRHPFKLHWWEFVDIDNAQRQR
ncbi:ABC transporter substrate-binding protein [Paucibacter soli]|uniref:ABC transporter substrate-binding protein n=1 Tax=Paucibacter soli TaxID=3133433 RepID=UPI0030962722